MDSEIEPGNGDFQNSQPRPRPRPRTSDLGLAPALGTKSIRETFGKFGNFDNGSVEQFQVWLKIVAF